MKLGGPTLSMELIHQNELNIYTGQSIHSLKIEDNFIRWAHKWKTKNKMLHKYIWYCLLKRFKTDDNSGKNNFNWENWLFLYQFFEFWKMHTYGDRVDRISIRLCATCVLSALNYTQISVCTIWKQWRTIHTLNPPQLYNC